MFKNVIFIFIFLAFLSCTNSDKIIEFEADTVVLNVKPQNIQAIAVVLTGTLLKTNLRFKS